MEGAYWCYPILTGVAWPLVRGFTGGYPTREAFGQTVFPHEPYPGVGASHLGKWLFSTGVCYPISI
ncbi:hypothetical protein J6590_033107 [Homalodisca vitripennis]|nr:hypothetical protein J6590_033107 [Homalodisca vitripennis]